MLVCKNFFIRGETGLSPSPFFFNYSFAGEFIPGESSFFLVSSLGEATDPPPSFSIHNGLAGIFFPPLRNVRSFMMKLFFLLDGQHFFFFSTEPIRRQKHSLFPGRDFLCPSRELSHLKKPVFFSTCTAKRPFALFFRGRPFSPRDIMSPPPQAPTPPHYALVPSRPNPSLPDAKRLSSPHFRAPAFPIRNRGFFKPILGTLGPPPFRSSVSEHELRTASAKLLRVADALFGGRTCLFALGTDPFSPPLRLRGFQGTFLLSPLKGRCRP